MKKLGIAISSVAFLLGVTCLILFFLYGAWHSLVSGIFATGTGGVCLLYWLSN